MNPLSRTALALVIVGALNWLLVGLFHFDLVAAIFGQMSVISRIVYVLVGLAGIYSLVLLFQPAPSATRADIPPGSVIKREKVGAATSAAPQ